MLLEKEETFGSDLNMNISSAIHLKSILIQFIFFENVIKEQKWSYVAARFLLTSTMEGSIGSVSVSVIFFSSSNNAFYSS